jgi:hypothetical protein
MGARRQPLPRLLPGRATDATGAGLQPLPHDAPRLVCHTLVDFSALDLAADVRLALAEAFWGHIGIRSARSICSHWFDIRTFVRFAHESGAPESLAGFDRELLGRYVEWLNSRCRADGRPWTIACRARTYTTLRTLLQWLERCRPGRIPSIEYPFNPFPWRNRDGQPRTPIPPCELGAILRACEADIAEMRTRREAATAERSAAEDTLDTLAGLLQYLDRHFGGIVPPTHELVHPSRRPLRLALARFGGAKQVEPYLYPHAESLLPYYLAILIHTAGNPDPIAELRCDCLQALPLLDDRQALVWFKPRAHSLQRRTFSTTDRFAPPALVEEILRWSERLRALAPTPLRDRVFLFKGPRGVNALSSGTAKSLLKAFCARHGLSRFALACIRPGVLSSFYRVSGDLGRTAAVANHATLAATVRYVDTPQVQAEHRARIAELQNAFIGHIEQRRVTVASAAPTASGGGTVPPAGEVVSLFGFGCRDPFAGIAPGTRGGELCTNFMGCFTCPNAIITPDPATLARLLQAREHLRAAAEALHPARWQAFYAPQLCILEEDILPRFTASELAAAQALVAQLPPLPDLR